MPGRSRQISEKIGESGVVVTGRSLKRKRRFQANRAVLFGFLEESVEYGQIIVERFDL
jgi:hypothetical protein